MEDIDLPMQEPEEELSIETDAKTLIEACKGKGLNSVPKCSLVSVSPEVPPYPPNRRLVKEQLSPSVPIIRLDKKIEGFEPWVEEFCRKYPIVMIRNLCSLVEFKLSLFWAETIAKKHPKGKMEIRTQIQQMSTENWDETYSKKVWDCYSHQSYTTIGKYKKYYNDRFNKTLNEAKKYAKDNQIDPRDENLFDIIHDVIEKSRRDRILFGTNVDLSCPKKWKLELQEIKKLPPFLQVNSDDNMLSHVDHKILGMNTVQLYIQVPGCRITGHQEDNNFCSVNINIGAGSCEWFAVSQEYWGALYSLCERNGVDFLHGSWWPPTLDELYKENIPVYRFVQHRGDVVWVNVGCIYWVHATGYCSTIAWPGNRDGWQYATDFPSQYHGKKQFTDYVRRRRWFRRCQLTTSGPWQELGNTKLVDVSLYATGKPGTDAPIHVWAVATNGEALFRRGVSESCPMGVSWEHIPSDQPLINISCGPCGQVWAVGKNGSSCWRLGISAAKPTGVQWQTVEPPSGAQLKQISVGYNIVWALDTIGRLSVRREIQSNVFPEGTHWQTLPAMPNDPIHIDMSVLNAKQGFRHVSISREQGQVWAISGAGIICRRIGVTDENPAGTGWVTGIAANWQSISLGGLINKTK